MTRTPRIHYGEARPRASKPCVQLVAGNLRRFAAARGLTMSHLADHAGIGRTTMRRLLDPNDKGASDPRLGTLEALADALEVDLADLLRPAPEAAS